MPRAPNPTANTSVESWVSEDELRKLRNDIVDKLAMVLGNLLVGGGWTR